MAAVLAYATAAELPGLALLAMAGVGCAWAAVRGARRHEHRTGER